MKRILSVLLFVSACSTSATSYTYIGCTWFIPTEYSKIADNEYRKLPTSNDLSKSFSSVMFSTMSPDNLATYIEMDRQPETEVLAFSHADGGGLSYQSLFVNRQNRLGDMLSSDILLVSRDDLVVSMLDVSQADSFHLTSACVPAQVIEQHYAVQKQLTQGIKPFLETDHGLNILVPAQN